MAALPYDNLKISITFTILTVWTPALKKAAKPPWPPPTNLFDGRISWFVTMRILFPTSDPTMSQKAWCHGGRHGGRRGGWTSFWARRRWSRQSRWTWRCRRSRRGWELESPRDRPSNQSAHRLGWKTRIPKKDRKSNTGKRWTKTPVVSANIELPPLTEPPGTGVEVKCIPIHELRENI